MATLFAACVDILPSPSDVLAVEPDSATHVEPLPTIKLPSEFDRPPIVFKLAFDAPLASSCVWIFELTPFKKPNSVLEIVPSWILVASIAALALMSALTIAPSVIYADVICESAIFAVVIWESAMCAVSILPST